MTILHGIEKYGNNHIEGPFMLLSFDTEYRGIWQARWAQPGGMSQLTDEPPFESLKGDEQEEIQEIVPIIWYFTFGELPNFYTVSE